MKLIQQSFRIEPHLSGNRLDQALQQLLPDFSRSRIQQWIQQGFVSLNDQLCKPKQKVFSGDQVELDVPEKPDIEDRPQPVEFGIVYEDDDVIVVDKPADLVVHPAAGHADGTLVNGLLQHEPRLAQLPRAGIVHRLDKDTTGLLVVARNLRAHSALVEQLQARTVKREYLAIAQGVITAGRSIETGIGRHPVDRKKMAVQAQGKAAVTHFTVLRRFGHFSLIRLALETGRTHQIRVHMAHIKHPLLGDPVYGGRERIPAALPEALAERIRSFRRQALHARALGFVHPREQRQVDFEAPPPADFQQLLAALEGDD